MPDTPHATSDTRLGQTTAVSLAQQESRADGSNSMAGPSFAGSHTLLGEEMDEDEEEEVMGAGCIAPGLNAAGSASSVAKSSAFAVAGDSVGLGDSGSSSSSSVDVPVRSESAVPAVATGASGSSSTYMANADLHQLVPISVSAPPRMMTSHGSPLVADVHLDPFIRIYASENGATVLDDCQAVSSAKDYSAVAYEAYQHWHISGFMGGSHRRRLRLVLTQLHFLLDSTPRIYAILDRKRILGGSAAAQARVERELNSHWSELKVHCSLLVLDKDAWKGTVTGFSLRESSERVDKTSFVQDLVASTVSEVIGNCALLWELFDVSVRGLLLIDSGRESLSSLLSAVQSHSGALKRMLSTLLDAYSVLPDTFKKAITSSVASAASSSPSGARLVVDELHGRRILPGALFKTLHECTRHHSQVVDVRRYLDNIFRTGAASWIGIGAGSTRPKYSAYGDDIREALYSHFRRLDESSQCRDLLSHMRVISGLIGYLRLETTDADHAFFKRASFLATANSRAVDTCAALLMVLVGFGSHNTAQDVLAVVSNASGTLVAGRVDCLLAYLHTNHAKDVNDFVTNTLAMDFAYPRERLFFIKDTIQQTKVAHFSGPDVAWRLLTSLSSATPRSACSSVLYRDAILYCLQGELFQQNGVDVREWITQAIFAVDAITASKYGALLKAYVDAVFSSAVVTPVPETLLWKAFSPDNTENDAGNCVAPSQVLLFLYVLYYCERLQDQSKAVGSGAFPALPLNRGSIDLYAKSRNNVLGDLTGAPGSSRTSSPYSPTLGLPSTSGVLGAVWRGEYSDQLLDSLPVAWILQRVSANTEYSLIWPELLAMSTTQFPDQLETVSVLQRELAASAVQKASRVGIHACQPPSRSLLSYIAREGDLSAEKGVSGILHAAEDFERLPISSRMKGCCAFAERICRSAILSSDNTRLTACVRQAWFALHALNPHMVSVATVNAWRSAFEATKPLLATQDMWLDPLVIFRSDPRVFESASLVDIFLTILSEFLMLSRTSMRRVFALRQKDCGALKKAHLSAIIQLQEAGSLQMLIEIARASLSDKVKHLIFEFVHARFLEQRTTQKLLHFQAYDVAAIGDMVAFVPSMHACSEFIPELLMQSAPRLQFFAIRLASAVLAKYPIATNAGMAKEVILPHILTTLVQLVGTDIPEQLAICNAMLEAVMTISATFPLVRDECKRLVEQVLEAADDRVRSAAQSAMPLQRQIVTKWIGCCESVLAAIRFAKQPVDGTGFTAIEDTSVTDVIARLEKPSTAAPAGGKSRHSGRGGSPGAHDSESPLSASSGTQQSGVPRQPGPLSHSFHQGQHATSPGSHKRPHSTIGDERAVASETTHAQGGSKKRGRNRNRKDGSQRLPGPGPKRNKAPAGDRHH
ncbi:hypothetical protein GGI20_001735 [Coemansia sp. BCRC 34301]|nr:hypothetical protein GGI20_001735 [Coemansia sp. BCRC 34301]